VDAYDRREFLRRVGRTGVAAAVSAGGLAMLAGCDAPTRSVAPAASKASLETTRLRMDRPAVCSAPQVVAEQTLRDEGFTDVQYVVVDALRVPQALASGELDINVQFGAPTIMRVDAGDPIVFLAGLHVGCFELFGTDQVRGISDLKGRTVSAGLPGGVGYVYLSSMAAYVGLDPSRDIVYEPRPRIEGMRVFAEGRLDALLALAPEAQELRANKVGHVIVNSALDRPWSQYFCCVVAGNREFVRTHPVATKRALRAILRAADICATQPEVAARALVDQGYTPRYDYALQAMRDIPYNRWREYDPEDTIRFYALRLHEVGMVKSSPNTILRNGTDWRFLNELKRELKA